MPCPSRLMRSLLDHGVTGEALDRIYDGFADVGDKSPVKTRTAFLRQAMRILDARVDAEQRIAIIEACACCLGGLRAAKVKRFRDGLAGQNLTLAEQVDRLRQAKPFYNTTVLRPDGTIRDGIYHRVDGKYRCACTMFSKARLDEPISATYCLCCAGHYRHHLQAALGLALKTKRVVSSPLASMGAEPCEFEFEVLGREQTRERLS